MSYWEAIKLVVGSKAPYFLSNNTSVLPFETKDSDVVKYTYMESGSSSVEVADILKRMEPETAGSAARLMTRRDVSTFFMSVDGTVRGVAIYRSHFDLMSFRREPFLGQIWVDETMRGSGLGHALLKTSMRALSGKNIPRFHLFVRDDNPAKLLYEKFSYNYVCNLPWRKDTIYMVRKGGLEI